MGRFSILAALLLLCATGAMAQDIQGVHPLTPPIQVGVDFNFVSFSEVPSTRLNNFGVKGEFVDYKEWLGFEAQAADSFGTQSGQTSQVLFAGGGVRLRWLHYDGFQPWGHVLMGYTHLSPGVSYGTAQAFGYKVGGGVDLVPRHSRFGFRASVDMFNTRFFHTYQISPEISAGVFIKLGRP